MSILLSSIIIVGGLGLLASVGLSIASIYLSIEVDPRVEKVESALPGANCGGCGYPGCSGYAKAVVLNDADISLCAPGGQGTIELLAQIMDKKVQLKEKLVARVHCNGTDANCERKMVYEGMKSCRAAYLLTDSTKKCLYGCEGLGDCVASCSFDAIVMGPGRIPIVNEAKCTSCGKCVEACPKNLITLEPEKTRLYIACSNPEKAKAVKDACKVGCIACGLCEKKCPKGAITIENGNPVWDHKKCDNLGVCAAVCPTGAIHDIRKMIPKAHIDPKKCTGKGECVKVCPVRKCIEGEEGKTHKVNKDLCCGCGLCVPVCPEKAITLKEGKAKLQKTA
ncbi:MAG: RnfABCDGE type electron transport complex subunit B [Acidobacteria bacterium]|nr:RnfABCDGE type electron transport complex subunit B [Acidobacteriota bacterium]